METVFDEDGWTLYKLRDGQVIRGFSGGAPLNRRTGRVCALIEATRAERAGLGGLGVPGRRDRDPRPRPGTGAVR